MQLHTERYRVRLNRNRREKTGPSSGLAGTARAAEVSRTRASTSLHRWRARTKIAEALGRLRSRSLVHQPAVVSCTMTSLVRARSSCCRRRFWAVGRPKRWTVRRADTTRLSSRVRARSLFSSRIRESVATLPSFPSKRQPTLSATRGKPIASVWTSERVKKRKKKRKKQEAEGNRK